MNHVARTLLALGILLLAGCTTKQPTCVLPPVAAPGVPTPVLLQPAPSATRVPTAGTTVVIAPGSLGETVRLVSGSGASVGPLPLSPVPSATPPGQYVAAVPPLVAQTTYEVFVDALIGPSANGCGPQPQIVTTRTFDLGAFTTQ